MFQKIPGQTLFEFVLVVLLQPLLGFVLRHEELLQLDWPIKYRMKINVSINTFPLSDNILHICNSNRSFDLIFPYRDHSISFCIKKHKCFLKFTNKILTERWFSRHFYGTEIRLMDMCRENEQNSYNHEYIQNYKCNASNVILCYVRKISSNIN